MVINYDEKWWAAYVNEFCSGIHGISVIFLHPHGPSSSYVFPQPQYRVVVNGSDILLQLFPSTAIGRTYALHRNDTDRANAVLE